MKIDWTNPTCQVTPHFTVNDCLMLHNWNRLATEDDGADFNKLLALCNAMESVRVILSVAAGMDCPINVHCMFRSIAYNLEQNILPPTGLDVHAMNLACDFDANSRLSITQVKNALRPQLANLGIRMEFGTTTWVHVDLHAPGPSGREFHV